MKHTAIASVVFAVSAALGTASFAQGRHDDKPHGMMKSAPAASEERGAPPVAGRHDERPPRPEEGGGKEIERQARRGQDGGRQVAQGYSALASGRNGTGSSSYQRQGGRRLRELISV